MEWNNDTIFKDPVLGYVSVPKAVVRMIIDNRIFQRLHDVAQTGMEALYPAATHNRFCHSIGVYHLGRLAFEYFQRNIKNQYKNIYLAVANSPLECDYVWNRWRFLFEMACLLHDCGHSPLSHSLEFLYDVTSHPGESIAEKVESNSILLAFFGLESHFGKGFIKTTDGVPQAYGAPHERMSACLLVSKDGGYYDNLRSLVEDQLRYYIEKTGSKSLSPVYSDNDFKSDLEFMVRCIIGYRYGESADLPNIENKGKKNLICQLRNCIISLLNGQIDVDNIDYSIRDATASGYKSAQVDYERLLKSCTIALAYEQDSLELTGEPFDFAVSLRKFVSGTASEENPVDLTLQGRATLQTPDIEPSQYTPDEETEGIIIVGNILEDGETSEEKRVRVIHTNAGSHIHVKLEKGQLEITPRYQDQEKRAALYIRSDTLTGRFTGLIFMGSTHSENDPLWRKISADKPLHIFPAYHKSALSVIQGALDAANFEHLWIYSHHATTYHNNFLSVYLLDKYAAFCHAEEHKSFLKDVLRLSSLCDRFQSDESNKLPIPYPIIDLFKQAQGKKDLLKIKITNQNRWNVLDKFFNRKQPDLMCKDTQTLYKTFLHCFCTLFQALPVDGQGIHEPFVEALVETARQLTQLDQDRKISSTLSEIEKESLANLSEHLLAYNRSAEGMPVMRDILGMPTVSTVNGQRYYRSSDADLRSTYLSLVKNTSVQLQEEYPELFDAIEQYETRHYLSAMWKSHAEFQFYVHGWKPSWFQAKKTSEKTLIQQFFYNSSSPIAPKDPNDVLYTFFSDSAVSQMQYRDNLRVFWEKCKERFNLEVLVYVPQKIRYKELDCSKTYIVWKKRIVTLQDIGFQTNQGSGYKYFYFYYRQKNGKKSLDVAQFMDFLKDILANYKPENNPTDSETDFSIQSLMDNDNQAKQMEGDSV